MAMEKQLSIILCAQSLSRVQLLVTLWAIARRLLCPWDFPGKNTGVGCHALLQGIFLTQGLNPHLLCILNWQVGSLPLARLLGLGTSLSLSTWVPHPSNSLHHIWTEFCRFHKNRNELGSPGGSDGKESACQCRVPGFDPWVRKIPWRRAWQPTPVFLPGESQDRGAWWATVPGVAKSQTRPEQLSMRAPR